MMPSRGMGDISPSKMPNGKKKARRDNTDFTQYAEGGEVKSKVNAKKSGKMGQRARLAQTLKGFK